VKGITRTSKNNYLYKEFLPRQSLTTDAGLLSSAQGKNITWQGVTFETRKNYGRLFYPTMKRASCSRIQTGECLDISCARYPFHDLSSRLPEGKDRIKRKESKGEINDNKYRQRFILYRVRSSITLTLRTIIVYIYKCSYKHYISARFRDFVHLRLLLPLIPSRATFRFYYHSTIKRAVFFSYNIVSFLHFCRQKRMCVRRDIPNSETRNDKTYEMTCIGCASAPPSLSLSLSLSLPV